VYILVNKAVYNVGPMTYKNIVLNLHRFRINTYGRGAFLVAGPMAWNSLPDFTLDPTSSTDCLRRLLYSFLLSHFFGEIKLCKTYLFARY